jgi:hypothetical protein
MPQAPKTVRVYDNGNAPIQAGSGVPVVFLVESNDGADLNNDNVLYDIGSKEEFEASIGRITPSSNAIETIQSYFDICAGRAMVGRITGTGGTKATTAVIVDVTPVTPVNTLQATWRGKGVNGNLYSLRVTRGRKSTTDTGAGRVDTKIELIEAATARVLGFQDELVMNVNSSQYALRVWNVAGYPCVLVDSTPADSYQNTDEPAVGTYAFSAGTDPASSLDAQIQLAVDKLSEHAETRDARIGVVDWTSTNVNYLAAKAESLSWKIVAYLHNNTTPSSAATFVAGVTTNLARVAVFVGSGYTTNHSAKRISGVGQVLAQMVVGARREGGRSVNDMGAGDRVSIWQSFDLLTPAARDGYALARVNPLYMKPAAGSLDAGVIVGDVLSLSNDSRYNQIIHICGEDLVVNTLTDWLDEYVNLKLEYPIQPKLGGVNTDITLDSLSRMDSKIKVLMENDFPKTLFGKARGKSGGWDWRGDTQTDSDGTNWVFWLGLDIAGVGRISTIKIGRVAGRFAVISAAQGG